jgi:hypothetical protein
MILADRPDIQEKLRKELLTLDESPSLSVCRFTLPPLSFALFRSRSYASFLLTVLCLSLYSSSSSSLLQGGTQLTQLPRSLR